ncbi:TetR/AcrR family transcriptional regulator [Rhodococcus sp. T7]|uniref:TetR/AcrR family transcriptional regulator n=1 Tax=Rhodococcus sp. T7 TaxID=627444 RepID=UPI00135A6034|nr:TetR/AcrR family transcriptional regulator [Rhodococcus sp. T7]KAF0956984.1 hypothetical protein MLGJGCBP_10064 [Rhodococcus sp. T7]KAF0958689.1 hypothetical protein MLGJGCBP_08189 [Rhodococcus sp. T7]
MSTQKRGRPKLDIDPDAVADAVAELFAEGGAEAVTIIEAAEKLQVSRATLYRTVPTKKHLLGMLFERSTRDLTEHARAVVERHELAWKQLHELVRILVDASIEMRQYMPVFFGGGDLPGDVVSRWHMFTREFEALWVRVVASAMQEGYLVEADPLLTARVLLGQCIWVSRWYRPSEPYDAGIITDIVLKLLPPAPGTSVGARSGGAGLPQRPRLVVATERPNPHVAPEIAVDEVPPPDKQVAQEKGRHDGDDTLDAGERAELDRLRRENAELRADREFLKKAAAFFASEHLR